MTNIVGLCDVCGRGVVMFSCTICGARVCKNCFSKGVCIKCRDAKTI